MSKSRLTLRRELAQLASERATLKAHLRRVEDEIDRLESELLVQRAEQDAHLPMQSNGSG